MQRVPSWEQGDAVDLIRRDFAAPQHVLDRSERKTDKTLDAIEFLLFDRRHYTATAHKTCRRPVAEADTQDDHALVPDTSRSSRACNTRSWSRPNPTEQGSDNPRR